MSADTPTPDQSTPPLDADELMAFEERIATLPKDDATWVGQLFSECLRARMAEGEFLARALDDSNDAQAIEQDITQIVLDAAEWLKTLWDVGYMGAGRLPATPRSAFPLVEMEDVLKSALLA